MKVNFTKQFSVSLLDGVIINFKLHFLTHQECNMSFLRRLQGIFKENNHLLHVSDKLIRTRNKYIAILALLIIPRVENFERRVVPKIASTFLEKHSLRSVVSAVKTFKMREIVHLQAGQCGNQIGSKASKQTNIYFPFFFIKI